MLRLCSIGSFSSNTAPFREPLGVRDPIKSARSDVGHTSLGTRIDNFCHTGKRTVSFPRPTPIESMVSSGINANHRSIPNEFIKNPFVDLYTGIVDR